MLRKYRKVLILSAIYFVSLAGLFLFHYHPLPVSCPFKMITGLPCPGCGGMRAAWALLHGDVSDALWMNPLSCLVIAFLILLPFIMIYDIVKCANVVDAMLYSKWPKSLWIVVIIILCANWIWNIIKSFYLT